MDIGECTRSIAKLLSIIAAVAVGSACSAAPPRAERAGASSSSTEAMTLERVLKQPLAQGQSGLRQVTASLLRSAGYPNKPGTLAGDTVTKDGLVLADGYRLAAIIDYTNAGVLSIALDREPCFPLDKAVAITGARPVAAVSYPYAEGPNYDTRSADRGGVELNLGRFSPGEKCLTEVRLVDIDRARKFVEENGIDLPVKNLDSNEGRR